MVNADLLVAGIGILGTVLSYVTVRTFHLRSWKYAMYYFIGAMSVISLYHLLNGLHVTNSLILKGTAELSFVGLVTYGIYRMQETAKQTGA